MAFSLRAGFAAGLSLTFATAVAQQAGPPATRSRIVQPGAPGKSTKKLTPGNVGAPARAPADADVRFMQGMIHHHSQAVEMVDLLRARGERKALLTLGERITISQSDEIQYM